MTVDADPSCMHEIDAPARPWCLQRNATSAGTSRHEQEAAAGVRHAVVMRPALEGRTRCRGARLPSRFAASLAIAMATLNLAPAWAQSRGELLYTTNCIACHTEQVHWRDRKLVRDWNSLTEQVRRWQDVASLGWRDDDIVAVARYLNHRYYGFDPADGKASLRSLGPVSPPPLSAGCRRTT